MIILVIKIQIKESRQIIIMIIIAKIIVITIMQIKKKGKVI